MAFSLPKRWTDRKALYWIADAMEDSWAWMWAFDVWRWSVLIIRRKPDAGEGRR